MSNAQFSFHFRKEFLSNLPNIFILAIGVKYKKWFFGHYHTDMAVDEKDNADRLNKKSLST